MRRAILVSDEMRHLAAFNTRVREIEALCQRPRSKTASRSMIRALMAQLLESPSERTVSCFLEIQERWGHLVDAYKFLENHWPYWATFKDALALIEHKFSREPGIEELIGVVGQADNWNSKLGLRYQLSCLIATIAEKCGTNYRLYRELMSLLALRFSGVVNVFRLEIDSKHRQRGLR